jgi:hypothetical protein
VSPRWGVKVNRQSDAPTRSTMAARRRARYADAERTSLRAFVVQFWAGFHKLLGGNEMETNPYQSPKSSAVLSPGGYGSPAQPRRPTAVTVFGVLNLVFGIFGIIGTLASLAMFTMPSNVNIPNPILDLMANNAVYRTFIQVSLALGAVAVIVLIVAGVGLLRMKPMGRILSNCYGVYAILGGIVGMIVNFMFIVQPLLEQAGTARSGPAQAGAIGGIIGGTFGGLLGLIYPVLLLIFINRRNVVEALRRGSGTAGNVEM